MVERLDVSGSAGVSAGADSKVGIKAKVKGGDETPMREWWPGATKREAGGVPRLTRSEQVNEDGRVRRLQEAIATQRLGWTAGAPTRMRNLTFSDARRLAGTRRRPRGSRKRLAQGGLPANAAAHTNLLPGKFDAREAWPACNASISRVRDQGVCGSCWAFGAVEALADRLCIASLLASPPTVAPPFFTAASAPLPASSVGRNSSAMLVNLSPEYLLSCARACDGCDGGYVDEAWRFLRDHGVDDEACTPYLEVTVSPSLCLTPQLVYGAW
jgi:hypothetical protein